MDHEDKSHDEQSAKAPPRNFSLSHQHQYDIAATDMTIVRWCPDCGKTWIIVRYAQGGLFESTWKEIHEP